MTERRTISIAYRFTNGAILVFDQYGAQMEEYQRDWSAEGWARVLRDAPAGASINEGAEWNRAARGEGSDDGAQQE